MAKVSTTLQMRKLLYKIMQAAKIIGSSLMLVVPTIVNAQTSDFVWSELPAIPDKYGFAGSFAGTSGGSLIVAGGANFPDGGAPWTGSKKVWTDQVFVLEKPAGKWKVAGKLPQSLGYGVSITWNDKLICIGGSNDKGHHNKALALAYNKGNLEFTSLPDLPCDLANSSGALAGNVIYVAGGLIHPDDKQCTNVFLSLDLSLPASRQRWNKLDTWPGPPRMLAVAGAVGDTFYLFSGAALVDAENGAVKRHYLNDAYCYTLGKGWKKLAQMPCPTVAAPSAIGALDKNVLSIFGGDTGELADSPGIKENHPGFSTQVLNYNIKENSWKAGANILVNKKDDSVTNPNGSLWAPVTVTSVVWNGKIIFPGGEVRPAVRTPRVRVAIPVKR
jgi:N-acetylneuraminic acid mutarotase